MTPERLPPPLASGLFVMFVGTEPGPMSLRLGEYYADATNRFYQHLALTKFTPRRLSAADCWRLPDYGIGLDDVYDNPEGLRSRMEAVTPRAICFNSRGALSRFVDPRPVGRLWRGAAAAQYAEFDMLVWATSDSSWNANQHWPKRIDDLLALQAALQGDASPP